MARRLLLGVLFVMMAVVRPDAAEAASWQSIRLSGEIRVCIWPDYYSISYRNPKTMTYSGIDIDMAHALSEELHLGLKLVPSSFASLVKDLQEDRCDIAGVGVTDGRKKAIDFSEPYLRSDIYAIAAKSNSGMNAWSDIDQSGTVVVVSKGTYHEGVMRDRLRHATLKVVNSPFEREHEVRSGRSDVFMTDYPYSNRFLEVASWAKRIAPSDPFYLISYAYAVQKGNAEWLDVVNSFLKKTKENGKLEAFAKKHGLEEILIK